MQLNGGRQSIFNDFSCTDSRRISPKETTFLSQDATDVSTNGEDATDFGNPGNPAAKHPQSPLAQDNVGLSKTTVLV